MFWCFRWGSFSIYDESANTYLFDDTLNSLFGGVPPSTFSNGTIRASDLNLNQLDGLLTQEGQGGENTLITQQTFTSQKVEQGHFLVFHFQVRNVSDQEIEWPITMLTSCFGQGNQRSSLAVDGIEAWTTSRNLSCTPTAQQQITLTFPPRNDPYNLVGLISASAPVNNTRQLLFAFISQSLALPQGLEWAATWR